MNIFHQIRSISIALILALTLSAAFTIAAFADEGTPPTEPIPPAEEVPVEETLAVDPTQEVPATEEASAEEPPVVVEEPSPIEQDPILLSELPEGTEVVVIDEQGDPVALASSEATEIIAAADPIWCPASIATPVSGPPAWAGGCSPSQTSFNDLLNWLALNNPNVAGTIWLEKTYDSGTATGTMNDAGDTLFSLDGTILTNMASFALTIKGGWNGIGTNTIDMTDPSEFNGSLHISDWAGDITLSDLVFLSTSASNALEIQTTKNIVLTRVTSTNNTGGRGASLVNNTGGGTGNVTVTNGTFSNNTHASNGYGLYIASYGSITLTDIVANSNGEMGASIGNQGAPTPKNVTLGGTLEFSSNNGYGLYVSSDGLITASNLTANYNGITDAGGDGANLVNSSSPTDQGITLTGINIFLGNYGTGLYLLSEGAITVNSVYANSNFNGIGVHVNNAGASVVKAVTFTGTNEFKNNGDQGIRILAAGAVTLSNVTASLNSNDGVEIDNTFLGNPAVTISGTNVFLDNALYGIDVVSNGVISLSSTTAKFNAVGASLDNDGAATPQNVNVTGINNFSNNTAHGLYVNSIGIISVSSVTASDNGTGYGAYLYNNSGVNTLMKGINVTGTNVFNNNGLVGLTTGSFGPIMVNNITANNTATGLGIQLYNLLAATPQAITMTGVNVANGNAGNGLNVVSKGAIKVNSLTASANGIILTSGNGATLDNSNGVAASTVILTGTNVFNGNYDLGLSVNAAGAISMNNVSASNNLSLEGAIITNIALGAASPQNVILTGINTFSGNYLDGLEIFTHGMVTASNLNASNNGTTSSIGYGAYLINNTATTAKSITLTGTNVFNGNYYEGLYIVSKGAISVSNLTASDSVSEDGAAFSNDTAGSPQNVTLSGINRFEDNVKNGFEIYSLGAISINSVTSTGNGFVSGTGYGAYLRNQTSTLPQNVSITGTNIFSSNRTYGLDVQTKGAITGNNITASNNSGGYGARLDNAEGLTTSAKGVTFTGTNAFSSNVGAGLQVDSYGPISITSVTANSNTTGFGAVLDNSGATGAPQNVSILGTNTFNLNPGGGLSVTTLGSVMGNNITASSSASGYGAQFVNNSSVLVQPITLSGTNVFSSNFSYGLQIYSKGAITVNNVTASSNANGVGANLVNAFGSNTSAQPVKITGTNVFNNDYLGGLAISSYGAITANNITVNNATTTDGVSLNNSIAAGPQAVTFTGTNYFGSNDGTGLSILTAGAISLSNIHADGNGTDGTGHGAYLDNSSATPLVQNLTISGINTFSNNGDSGLELTSKGTITLSNMTASSNQDYGANVQNNFGATNSAKAVTFTGVNQFNSNVAGDGLQILSFGPVSLSAVTANLNGTYGVNINNSAAANPQAVAFSGVNTFNSNVNSGLNVNSKGAISSGTSLTANLNGFRGADLYNTAGTTGGVSLLGTNTFINNTAGGGLLIHSVGAISLSNVTASENGNGSFDYGAELNNTFAATPMNVTFSGVNVFNDNYDSGLNVSTEGAISLNSVTANNNSLVPGFYGVVLDNTATEAKTVTLSGTNTFNGNGANGLQIWSKGSVTLSNVMASNNANGGADIQNYTALAPQFVSLTGTNVFNDNLSDTGLQITSAGAITVNNLTANGNANGGASLDNDEPGATAASKVTLTGTHFFNDNTNLGLRIRSASTVTLSKLTADNNASEGLEIDTTGAVTLACASITSNGTFGIDIINALSLTLKGVISSGNASDLNYAGVPIIVRTCP